MTTISIQYKGTDTCLDHTCPKCDTFAHYCVTMPFIGAVRCPECKTVWVMAHRIDTYELQDFEWGSRYFRHAADPSDEEHELPEDIISTELPADERRAHHDVGDE